MAAITHTVCPLPDLIIFKEWQRFSRRAQPGDATPHASLMKKTRERERESQLIISHVPQVINCGESGEKRQL